MAKDENGKWVTIKGTPVFIKEGQTLSQAFANRRQFTKDGRPKNKPKEKIKKLRFDKEKTIPGFRGGPDIIDSYNKLSNELKRTPTSEEVFKDMVTNVPEYRKDYNAGEDPSDFKKNIKRTLKDYGAKEPSGYELFLANENGLKIGKGQDNILEYDLKKQAVKYKEDPTTKNKQKYNKRREDVIDYEHKKEGKIAKEFNGRYRESEYGDRYYNDETIKTPLNTLTASLNKSYEDIDADFKSRIVDGNIEIYDANEVIGSNWNSKLDSYVKEIFGENAYLEPIDSVSMNIAGVYVDKANKWQDTWAKENGKSAQDMARIERAVGMYEDGDIGEDELKDYFRDWNEMRSYQYNKARDERRDAFFSKDAYSKENMKKKDEIIAKEPYGDYDSAFARIARDSAEIIFQMDNSDSLKKQLENVQEQVKSGYGYNKDNLNDTLTRLKNLNSSSLTAQFIDERGEEAEKYARNKYGDDKVDTALWVENQLMQKGYNKIYTQLEPNGRIYDSKHKDMIIQGDMPEKNLSITYNFNDKGESVISIRGMSEPGVYGDLILNDKNAREIRDITSGSSIGGYPVIKNYVLEHREPKLTTAEKKEYYDKVNAYYKEHYSDGYNEYARKVREDIIKRRG